MTNLPAQGPSLLKSALRGRVPTAAKARSSLASQYGAGIEDQ